MITEYQFNKISYIIFLLSTMNVTSSKKKKKKNNNKKKINISIEN